MEREHMITETVCITHAEYEDAQQLCALEHASPDGKECSTLMLWQGQFPDGVQFDLKVCNGDSGPWTECVLFDAKGNEIGCSEVSDSVLGEWYFDNHMIIVKIEGT
jgi:hypothetical protein